MNKITLKVLYSGCAEVDNSWNGSVVSPTDSRLYFILDGSFHIISSSGEKIVLSKGNSYLIPSGYSFDYGCEDRMSHLYFHILLSSFDGLDILGNVGKPLSCPFSKAPEIPKDVLDYSDIVGSLQTESFITASLFSLLKENGVSVEQKHYSKGVKIAIEYIRKHLSVQLSIKDISNECFLAPSTLTRNFRQETGMSIGEYIDFLIFRESEKMLKTTDMTVLEISDKLGFCDQFYFSRKFAEKHGFPPSKYRRLSVDI
ncbi:MAG: helix-turn-helix transcriptional regulator [Ruminococcaceae bacterium]|nr:helix-turn-helix transcriptional regulator [Oscillospiraceae bacterium]